MRRILTAVALAAFAVLLVWVFRPDPVPVETAEVTRGDLAVAVEAEGEARIREVIVLSAPITGMLHRVTLHPGDAVEAGQGVAQIGPVLPTLLDARTRAMAEASAAAAASTSGSKSPMDLRLEPVMRSRVIWGTTSAGKKRTISCSTMRFEDGMMRPTRATIRRLPVYPFCPC